MNEWFRSWHGAPTDPKWLGIARKAGVAPGIAVAVAWALMDRASQARDRGSIEGYDADGLGCFYGCEAEQVEAIVQAMEGKGMIADGRFTAWSKRQPAREDGSAERAKAWRERNKPSPNDPERTRTQTNAGELERTLDTDTDKKEREDAAEASPSPAAPHLQLVEPIAPPDPTEPERQLFILGKKLLGPSGGGMVAKVLKAKGGNVSLARAVLEIASTKADPRQYLGAIVNSREKETSLDLLRLRGDAW